VKSENAYEAVTQWLRVQFPATALSSNNLRQVIHTHMCLCHQAV